MYSKLLIPLDGSNAAEQVLPFVDQLIGALHLPIELLAVVDISVATTRMVADKARYLDKMIAAAEQSCERYLTAIAGRFAGLHVKCTVERGKPADAIIDRATAERGTLIAMATHGRAGLNRWLIGSVAEKVLRGTNRPLFLVRNNPSIQVTRELSFTRIIVPLDGSEIAAAVLPNAIDLAKGFDAELMLFRAYELPASAYTGREDHLPNYEELKQRAKRDAQNYLDEQADMSRGKGLSKVVTVVAEGPAADEIIRCAAAYAGSIVVMCTHGRSGIQRWVLGSVAETVARHIDGPVMVLRAA
jgi:nucleotide-binding universal stress UspA family protein